MKRIAVRCVGALAIAGFLLWPTDSASAHSSGGTQPSSERTVIESVVPQIDGVTLRVINFANKIELENLTTTDIIVLGYQGEPYLRIGPTGAFENRLSPTTYINKSRDGDADIPDFATIKSVPDWVLVNESPWTQWHDHRAHSMSNAQFPSSSMSFSINLKYGNVDVVVIGQIQRVNKPSALPWLLLAIVAGAIVVASATYWPSMRRQIIGVAIAILVVVDIFHAIGATQFSHEQTRATFVATFFSENFFLIPSWLLGTLGLILVLRRRTDGYYAISFAAISIALFGGFFDILSLSRPLLPNAFDDVFTRASVALSIGMGLATAATAFKTVMGDPQRRHLTNIQVSTETADKIVV